MFARSVDESFTLDTHLDDSEGPLIITVDSGQLTSSIINLILNAREASSAGGRILLSVARVAEHVVIEVTDSGRGMTEKELEAASEPFYTTKSLSEGSGLGLSMVEGFIKQSGAELKITSKVGQGTTVRLTFEAADSQAELSIDQAYSEDSDLDVTVLLVEDEEQIRSVLTLVLESVGYTVVTASDGADALEKLSAIEDLSLLITDQIMPGDISGEQLIVNIREIHPQLPALLMSGYSENLPTGYPFLAKPFSTQALLLKVRELVATSRAATK
jgi:CheY-like chemotaxis protein